MSRRGEDLPDLVGELARTTEQLREELDGRQNDRGLRPPSPGDLVRFTSEVTIPAIILVLETNVRALRLLQRTLQFAQGRTETTEGSAGGEARRRAEDLGRETLGRLDTALADLQDALSGRPSDDEARELLEEARTLRTDIENRLETSGSNSSTATDREDVEIDVDAELQSIKDDVDDDSGENSDA